MDVPVLVAARLLKPLGNPRPNSVKFFENAELVELLKDRAWLVKMTTAVNQALAEKESAKKSRGVNGSQDAAQRGCCE